MELLIGCGSSRERRLLVEGRTDWTDLVTLDSNEAHRPDVVWNLEEMPWPFPDGSFSEVHAYEVIEHLGRQGDARSWFAFFGEVYRILEPGGFLAATCPSYRSIWAWGDPSHTRIVSSGSLVFLDQEQYIIQVGKTPMSDFRWLWKGDLKAVWADVAAEARGDGWSFVLTAIKPARISVDVDTVTGVSCTAKT